MLRTASYAWEVFVIRWNWKTALLSAITRLAVWPASKLGQGKLLSSASFRALAIEFAFRLVVGGLWGSLLQAFSAALPTLQNGIGLVIAMVGFTHVLEYVALRAGGAAQAGALTVTSIGLSALSLFINWRLMRLGMLLTGKGTASLGADLRRIFRIPRRFSPIAQSAGESIAEAVPYEH